MLVSGALDGAIMVCDQDIFRWNWKKFMFVLNLQTQKLCS